MNRRIEIHIEDKDSEGQPFRFSSDDGAGAMFTAVEFFGPSYGRSSPCISEEEIQDTVRSCCEWIRREGDIPIVIDHRVKQATLTEFFGNVATEDEGDGHVS